MAGNDSLTYCDSEEECFFGKVTEKELLKSALFGQNYDSPAVERTPRRINVNPLPRSTLALPDVLQGSTSRSERNDDSSAAGEENENNSLSKHFPSVNSSFNGSDEDIEIIDLDSQNDSVQIISDDDSFLKNENLANQDTSKNMAEYRSVGLSEENNISLDASELENKSFSCCQVLKGNTSKEIREFKEDMSTDLKNICEIIITTPSEGETCELDETHDPENELVSNKENMPQEINSNKANLINEVENSDFRVETFDETIDLDKNELKSFEENEAKMIYEENSTFENKDPTASVIETLIQASIQIERESNAVNKEKDESTFHSKNPSNISGLLNLDCSSLNAVSDSILNISCGSSVSSPAIESGQMSRLSLKNEINKSSSLQSGTTEKEDLHMSVDEPDVRGNVTTSTSASQPSLYESCLNTSLVSHYYSANNERVFVSQQPSNSFTNYRDTLDDSSLFEGVSAVPIDLHTNDEAKKETSFELVAKNRENTFDGIGFDGKSEITNEQNKPKKVSKLPVFHGTKNLIQPSKLNVKPDALKTSNFKWAEHFKKLDKMNKTGSGEKRLETKIATPKTNTSSSSPLLKSQGVKNKFEKKTPSSKVPSHIVSRAKTPSDTNQPGSSLNPSRLVNSDSKTKMTLSAKKCGVNFETKERNLLIPGIIHGKIGATVSQQKNKYHHIISPIQTYINSSTVVLHKKVTVDKAAVVTTADKAVSRIPTQASTKTTKAVQRLHFENHEGQENVAPNYSRDSLPPVHFEPAESVFIRNLEKARNLPKIGAKMQRLIDSPRAKITIHQGRVSKSPLTEGVLIPNTESNNTPNQGLSSDIGQGRISVRVVKSAEKDSPK